MELFFHKTLCCRSSLESPRRGDFNEYPQHRLIDQNYLSVVINFPPYLFYMLCYTLVVYIARGAT